MKIKVYLNIVTTVCTEARPQVKQCFWILFMREFATNALPALGNKLVLSDGFGIGRFFQKIETCPVVTEVRQVTRRGILDHEVVYTDRVDLTEKELSRTTGHTYDLITDPDKRIEEAGQFEADYFDDKIRPLLGKEGFVHCANAVDTDIPKP